MFLCLLSEEETVKEHFRNIDKYQLLLQYLKFGIVFTVFLAILILVLKKIRYNYQRIATWLSFSAKDDKTFQRNSKVMTGLFWFSLAATFIFLLLWGIFTAINVEPNYLGVSLIFLGLIIFPGIYGFFYWKSTSFRANRTIKSIFIFVFVIFFAFEILLTVIIKPFSFIGFSSVFLTLNMLPMTIIVFINSHQKSLKFKTWLKNKIELIKVKKNIENGSESDQNLEEEEEEIKDSKKKTKSYEIGLLKKPNKQIFGKNNSKETINLIIILYTISLAILLTYSFLVLYLIDEKKYLGFVQSGAIIFLDIILFLFTRTQQPKSPTFICVILIIERVLIISFGTSYWFVGHSIIYFIFSIVLAKRFIDIVLPKIDRTQTTIHILGNPLGSGSKNDDQQTISINQDNDNGNSDNENSDNNNNNNNNNNSNNTHSDEDDLEDNEENNSNDNSESDELNKPNNNLNSNSQDEENDLDDDENKNKNGKGGYQVINIPKSGEINNDIVVENESGRIIKKKRLTKKAISNLIVYSIFTIVFVVELILVSTVTKQTKIELSKNKPHEQYIAGIGSIILTLIFPMLLCSYRYYQNHRQGLNAKVLMPMLIAELTIIGSTIFWFFLTRSVIVLCVGLYFPIILMIGLPSYYFWIEKDYDFLGPKEERKKPNIDNAFVAFFKSGLSKHDYFIILGFLLPPVLIILMGMTIALANDPEYVGWTISAVLMIIYFTFLPIKRWFNTLAFHYTLVLLPILGFAVLCFYCLGMYFWVFNHTTKTEGLSMVFVLIGYPILVFLIFVIYKWKDDNWQITKFIKISLASCLALFLTVSILISILVDPWTIGIGLVYLFILFVIILFLVIMWIQNKFYLPKKYKWLFILVIVLTVLLGIGIGLQTKTTFIAITISWYLLIIIIVLYIIQKLYNIYFDETIVESFNENFFPIYQYNAKSNNITEDNSLGYYSIAVFFAIWIWGIMATVYINPSFIGISIAAVTFIFAFVFILHCIRSTKVDFSNSMNYIDDFILLESSHNAWNIEYIGKVEVNVNESVNLNLNGIDNNDDENGNYDDINTQNELIKSITKISKLFGLNMDKLISDNQPNNGQNNEDEDLEDDNSSTKEKEMKTINYWLAEFKNKFNDLKKNDLTNLPTEYQENIRKGYQYLIKIDDSINSNQLILNRFMARFKVSVILSAKTRKLQQDLQFKNFLREIGMPNITISEITLWDEDKKREFERKRQQYLIKKQQEKEEEERRLQEEIEAQKRRNEFLRQQMNIQNQNISGGTGGTGGIGGIGGTGGIGGIGGSDEIGGSSGSEASSGKGGKGNIDNKLLSSYSEINEGIEIEKEKSDSESDSEDDFISQNTKQMPSGQCEEELLIIKQCQKSGEKFTDPDFPPNMSSIVINVNNYKDKLNRVKEWKRASEIPSEESEIALFKEGMSPEDIEQGSLGDCYLLSSISVLSLKEEKVLKIFLTKKYQPEFGFFIVRFFSNDQWHKIIVDDYLPCGRNGRPIFARSKNNDELWVQIIEKAYAKLFGSYEAIEGGFVHLCLVNLTGGMGEMFQMNKQENLQEVNDGRLWQKLLQYQNAGYLLGAGSHSGSDTSISDKGIVLGHAYGILDVQFVDNNKLIKLRNPWGDTEWNGDWSDKSSLWTKRMKQKLNWVDEDDGSFWMNYEDFTKNYKNLYVCKIFDENKWQTKTIKDRWQGESAGGCINFSETTHKNPQFALQINKPTHCYIVLTQEDSRGLNRENFNIGIYIVKKEGKKLKNLYVGEKIGTSGNYISYRSVSCEITLDPYEYPYTIFVSTYKPGEEAKFWLTVRSDEKVKFEKYDENVEYD
ncbi:calpain [Anaeramoeba flamelloides]|uniref:Calpain n=1 Tax=Anaeramoeba flamelloides TaxID=1746091 RepID=A0AAV7ZNW8_9EUKA|nr:calpain [Anaeramoeba flamelloides]